METNGESLTLNRVNFIQLEAETALYYADSVLSHLKCVPGFAGVKAKAADLRKALEYVVNECNKLEASDE